MKAIARTTVAVVVSCSAALGPTVATAWWEDNDRYDRYWGGGPWHGGYPGYGRGGYPGYGWGGYPGYGWGGYPGYGGGGSPHVIYLDRGSSATSPPPRYPQ
ncbi:MAG: hypothetical protein ABFS23_07965 [Pseudomonadota bacterium]